MGISEPRCSTILVSRLDHPKADLRCLCDRTRQRPRHTATRTMIKGPRRMLAPQQKMPGTARRRFNYAMERMQLCALP